MAGFMREHQTKPGPDIDDFTRADINGGEPASSSRRVEDVSPPRRHEFHLYAVYYPVGGCRNNGAFHVPPATKVFAASPSVSSTYLTRLRFAVSSSLSLHAEKNELNLIEYRHPLLIPY